MANGVFHDFKNFKQADIKSKEVKVNDNEIIVDTTDFSKIDFDKIIESILDSLL